MIKFSATIRQQDDYGSGEYGASRGSRLHKGVDFAPQVHAVTGGKVTKLGHPYANDLSYRYVQVTDKDGYRVRYFYVSPSVAIGDVINEGQILGLMQDLGRRYHGTKEAPRTITPHFHFEVMDKRGACIDPITYLDSL